MSWNETSFGIASKRRRIRASVLHLTWMEAESCKSSCRRRGRMDEDWVTSSKTNMYLGSGLMLPSAVVHEFAVVDELSHQTYDHIVAVVEASYFRGADVVAITDVETQSPLVFDVFQQLTANLARDYREAALAIDKVSGVLDLQWAHSCSNKSVFALSSNGLCFGNQIDLFNVFIYTFTVHPSCQRIFDFLWACCSQEKYVVYMSTTIW